MTTQFGNRLDNVSANGQHKESDEHYAKSVIDHIVGDFHDVMVNPDEADSNASPVVPMLKCLLSGGNLLLEDEPGVGKTVSVRVFSQLLGLPTNRIQLTPDLLPREITGWSKTDGSFHKGPVFANIVHADEIRRATPKSQSALLEVMEEQQVTVDGETHAVPMPFLLVATTNPEFHEGAYPLPQAELDRFAASATVRPPKDRAKRGEIARRNRNGGVHATLVRINEEPISHKVIDRLLRARQRVVVPGSIDDDYVPAIVDAVKTHRAVQQSPTGVRSEIFLGRLGQAEALFAGRATVMLEDVDAAAQLVLPHRFELQYDAVLDGVTKRAVINDAIRSARETLAREQS